MELFCLVCQAECLAVALRMGHRKIGRLVFPEISALHLCQNGDRNAVQSADAADDGAVVAEVPVAVHLIEIGKDPWDIVPDCGTVFAPGSGAGVPTPSGAAAVLPLSRTSCFLFPVIAVEFQQMRQRTAHTAAFHDHVHEPFFL